MCEILTCPHNVQTYVHGVQYAVYLFDFLQLLLKVVFMPVSTIFRKVIASVFISSFSVVVNKTILSLHFLPGDFGI